MPSKIHADLKISEIVRQYPATRNVFLSSGLGKLVSEEGMRVLAPFLSLGTALRSRSMNEALFVQMLETAAAEYISPREAPGLASLERQSDLSLLALMPCGLKMPFSRSFTEFISSQVAGGGALSIQYAVEGNLNQELSYYAYADTLEKAEELPDIVVSSDFNVFYGHRFYKQFVKTGFFEGYGHFQAGKNFRAAGILDPEEKYSILCVNPLVIVANLEQMNGRPLPETWEDILDPAWERSLFIRGSDDFFCHAVLLPIYQDFGADGLKALAANVAQGLHPSQMINRIDKNAPGALYVMPEFFAGRIRRRDRIRIIWPEDGALASPVTLQVKPEKKQALKPVLDYLVGKDLASTLAAARFPVPHADIEAEVQEKPLKWLGWDYLRENDLTGLNQRIDEIFMPLAKSQQEKHDCSFNQTCHCRRPAFER